MSNLRNPADLGTKSFSMSRIKLLYSSTSSRSVTISKKLGAAESQVVEQSLAIRRISRAARSRFSWLAAFALTQVADRRPQQEEGPSRKKFGIEGPPFAEMIGAILAV